jgi:hypothetical protein
MPRRTRDGYVFYEDQHYLRKIGTHEFFPYSPELAAREDMQLYDPWAHKTQGFKAMPPGVGVVEYHGNKTKELTGYTREEIRAVLTSLNRTQRLLWCIDVLFRRSAFRDIEQFFIIRNDLIRIMGPGFTLEEAHSALKLYKTNPDHVEILIAEAATPDPPTPEVTVTTEVKNDLDPTLNFGGE